MGGHGFVGPSRAPPCAHPSLLPSGGALPEVQEVLVGESGARGAHGAYLCRGAVSADGREAPDAARSGAHGPAAQRRDDYRVRGLVRGLEAAGEAADVADEDCEEEAGDPSERGATFGPARV